MTVQIFFNLQNHPTFHPEEMWINLGRGRECSVGLSTLFVYYWTTVYNTLEAISYESVSDSSPELTSIQATTKDKAKMAS